MSKSHTHSFLGTILPVVSHKHNSHNVVVWYMASFLNNGNLYMASLFPIVNIINHIHAHLVGFGGVCMGSVHYAQCYQTWGVGSTVTASTCVTSVVCVTM